MDALSAPADVHRIGGRLDHEQGRSVTQPGCSISSPDVDPPQRLPVTPCSARPALARSPRVDPMLTSTSNSTAPS